VDNSDKITVSREALQHVLRCLNGPAHHIRELQCTRMLLGQENAIDVLVREYQEATNTTPLPRGNHG
jgi:hypothetical protein